MTVESRLGCPDPFGSDGMAAFHTVDHDILLQRLKVSFGFTDVALQWLQSYLVGRHSTYDVETPSQPSSRLFLECHWGQSWAPYCSLCTLLTWSQWLKAIARHHTCMPTIRCWLGLLTCKTVSQITYTVLVETLNPAQSINQSWLLSSCCSRRPLVKDLRVASWMESNRPWTPSRERTRRPWTDCHWTATKRKSYGARQVDNTSFCVQLCQLMALWLSPWGPLAISASI